MSDYLHDRWRELRNDASPRAVGFVRGAIDALRYQGILSDDIAELWERRIETCPGHDDEGGRSWCAYCGPATHPSVSDGGGE